MTTASPRTRSTLVIVSIALFMVVLDNLIVTVALPSIREDLGATLQSLEWTINAYTLAFAVMLIPGAALGDRFGRRRMFLAGLALLPVAALRLRESHGPSRRLDLPGVALVATGLFALVFGLIRGQAEGWTSTPIVAALAGGAAILTAFVGWQRRAAAPMVPMAFFRRRAFAVTNAVSFFMYFGTFGSIFLITQLVQVLMGFGPLEAGIRMLVWTGATTVVAPLAGVLAERFGARGFMAAGLALQASALGWIAAVAEPAMGFGSIVIPPAMAGAGMAPLFAPSAGALLAVVRPDQAGQASGTNNAIREVGGVFGVAVLSTIFAGSGGFGSAQAFIDGFVPAVWG